jgi:hypothetical protein
MDLFDRLDDVDAGEGESERRADPLDRRPSTDHERPPDRRRVKRLAPEDRREVRTVEHVAQLRLRAIRARPDPATRRNNHDNSPFWRGNAPQLFE